MAIAQWRLERVRAAGAKAILAESVSGEREYAAGEDELAVTLAQFVQMFSIPYESVRNEPESEPAPTAAAA